MVVGIGNGLIRLVASGNIGAGQTWSTGIYLDTGVGTGGPTQAQLDAVCASAQTATRTWADTWKAFNCPLWQYTHLNAYYYEPNTLRAAMQSTVTATTPVTGTGNAIPLFTSIVASLRTATPGRSGRGRIYIPTTGVGLDTNGQLTTALCGILANSTRDLIRAYNSIAIPFDALSGACVVASFSKNAGRPITSVHVNSMPDVQHRRIDKLGFATESISAI